MHGSCESEYLKTNNFSGLTERSFPGMAVKMVAASLVVRAIGAGESCLLGIGITPFCKIRSVGRLAASLSVSAGADESNYLPRCVDLLLSYRAAVLLQN